MSEINSNLAEPLRVGKLELSNRIVLAPLTRNRADDNHVPSNLAVEYYSQRASFPGTLLISEGTFPAARLGGYDNVPGIYNSEQIKGWKNVTDAVHAKGSFIFCQLWGLGRAATPEVLAKEGNRVISSGNLPMPNGAVPQPLDEAGIEQTIEQYTQAAKNAIAAGFDGVEVHSANGYLIDQFLQDTCNNRTDRWGGSIENRARFGLEVTKRVIAAIGSERTGFRISPWGTFQGMRMKDPRPTFKYYVDQLSHLNLAYLHIVEPRVNVIVDIEPVAGDSNDFLIDAFRNSGAIILCGGFKPEFADKTIEKEKNRGHPNVATAFGRPYIANPDMPYRAIHNVPLTHYDRSTFYTVKSGVGYVDYPYSKAFLESRVSKL